MHARQAQQRCLPRSRQGQSRLQLRLAQVKAFGPPAVRQLSARARGPIVPTIDVADCIASAESGAEAEECVLPMADPAGGSSAAPAAEVSEADKRSMLMGQADSLQECLSSAENAAEVEECAMDYEQLVKGPSAAVASTTAATATATTSTIAAATATATATGPSAYVEPGDSEALSVGPAALVVAVLAVGLWEFLH